MANDNNTNETTGSILDTIREQTTNIEAYTTKRSFELTICDELKKFASKERKVRESTISVKITASVDQNSINTLVEQEWTQTFNKAPPSFWQDKQFVFIQFADKEDKLEFMRKAKGCSNNRGLGILNGLISKENSEGYNFIRKEIKLEITNVREQIKPAKIEALLKSLSNGDMYFSEIKAGKLYGPEGRQQRSLMLRVNGAGFDLIFNHLNGTIPYNSPEDKITVKLWPRVNVRPWSCRDCYFIGPNHQQCQGKSCAQCGAKDHLTKTCKSKTRYCTNCRRSGHKARDSHCPAYVKEIVKEIKRMDIPLDFLEDEIKRFELAKILIYK